MPKRLTILLLAAAFCAGGLSARADFIKIDDFDSLSLGNINGQAGWTSAGSGGNVIVDPTDSANHVLGVTTGTGNLYVPATLADGASGTLFFRMRINGKQNMSVGMSDVATPGSSFDHFRAQLNMNDTINTLRVRDLTTFRNLTTLTPDVWYNFWMVMDNGADTLKVYMNSTPLASAGIADQLDSGGITEFTFRGGVKSTDLIRLFIKTGDGDGGHLGTLYLDDFYLDSSGANLLNPVPEPGTWAMLLAGLLPLAWLRRRWRA